MSLSPDLVKTVTVEALACEHCGLLFDESLRFSLSDARKRQVHKFKELLDDDEWIVPCGGTIFLVDVKPSNVEFLPLSDPIVWVR